jgi:membrane protein DedA with SNARE-associated domain
MDEVLDWITAYGYPALFLLLLLGIVGLPVPDETLLTFAGYLIFTERLNPLLTWIAAFCGTGCGITLSYCLGRGLGGPLLNVLSLVSPAPRSTLDLVQAWYVHRGKYLLVVGYFLPGFRHVTALIAGASHLPVQTFAAYAYTGGLLWSLTFLILGYFVGEEWARSSAMLHRILVIATIAGGVSILVGFYWARNHRRKS